jgi:hypothetical protein
VCVAGIAMHESMKTKSSSALTSSTNTKSNVCIYLNYETLTPSAEKMEQLNNVTTHHVMYEVIIFPDYHSEQHQTQYK